MANKERHALILSGGGANGAYEVGVLRALMSGRSPATDYKPLNPDVLAGTSIGAFNASLLLSLLMSDGARATDRLEEIWRDVIPGNDDQNRFYRYRANPLDFLYPGLILKDSINDSVQVAEDLAFLARDWYRRGLNFFLSEGSIEQRALKLFDLSTIISSEPAYRLITETIRPENILRSETVLRVATTNWRTGDLRVFGNSDVADEKGARAVLASMAIPGIFAQVEIDGEYYADGGLVMNTPLNLGIDAGADVLHIMYLNPGVKAIPLLPVRNTIDTVCRLFAIQFAATVDRDIEVADRINRGVAILENAKDSASLSERDVRPFVAAAGKLARIADAGAYRKITIHRYQPRDVLGGVLGVLDFSRDRIIDLIRQGFSDTVTHDCATCVLPS